MLAILNTPLIGIGILLQYSSTNQSYYLKQRVNDASNIYSGENINFFKGITHSLQLITVMDAQHPRPTQCHPQCWCDRKS